MTEEEERKSRRRAHDVNEAIKTLRLAIDDIASGYRFDDQFAADKLKMLQQTVVILESEVDAWVSHLKK